MRMRYQWPSLTREQRVLMECLLLDQIERQNWYAIVFLELWRSEGLICIN